MPQCIHKTTIKSQSYICSSILESLLKVDNDNPTNNNYVLKSSHLSGVGIGRFLSGLLLFAINKRYIFEPKSLSYLETNAVISACFSEGLRWFLPPTLAVATILSRFSLSAML